MKKILSLLFCVLLCLTACAPSGQQEQSVSDSVPTTEAATAPTEEATQSLEGAAIPEAYGQILSNIIRAYPWNDDELDLVPEQPELSYMYRRNTDLAEVGFALMDLDGNGTEELILGWIDNDFVYDVYTLSEGQAVHILAGHERNTYFLCENAMIENQWSGGAALTGNDFYRLHGGSLELVERITFDAYHALDAGVIEDVSEANDHNCYFASPTENPADYRQIPIEEAIDKLESYREETPQLEIGYTSLAEYTE